jgi:GGDEF domain-containing protein
LNELIRTDSTGLLPAGGVPAGAAGNRAGKRRALAERLRRISPGRCLTGKGKITITASFGVLGFSAGQLPKTLSAEAVLNRVDGHLYRAKKQGRNRVVSGPFAS